MVTVQAPRDPTRTKRRRRVRRTGRRGRVVVLIVVCALGRSATCSTWPSGRAGAPIDRLADPTFAAAARSGAPPRWSRSIACQSPAFRTPPRSGHVLVRANGAYTAMLDDPDDLQTLAPAGPQRRRANEWLGDWRTYLGDRERYADALRTKPDAPDCWCRSPARASRSPADRQPPTPTGCRPAFHPPTPDRSGPHVPGRAVVEPGPRGSGAGHSAPDTSGTPPHVPAPGTLGRLGSPMRRGCAGSAAGACRRRRW